MTGASGEHDPAGGVPLVAEGRDARVSIVGHKVVVQRKGVKGLLQRGLTLYRDPRSLAAAFTGPSKKVIAAALAENKELAKVIIGAVKRPGAPGAPGGPDGGDAGREGIDAAAVGRALLEGLKDNREAVLKALRDNDTLVKAWLRDHKDLAGIVLKGDVHVLVEDVASAGLARSAGGARVFVLTVDGEQVQVPYDPGQDQPFRRLCEALGAGAPGPGSGLSPPALEGHASAPAPAGTKTCPMCAEEVKAAALLCRFCGHRFDRP